MESPSKSKTTKNEWKEAQIRLTHIQKKKKEEKQKTKTNQIKKWEKTKPNQTHLLKVDNRKKLKEKKSKPMNQKERISYPLDKPAIALNLRKGRVNRVRFRVYNRFSSSHSAIVFRVDESD